MGYLWLTGSVTLSVLLTTFFKEAARRDIHINWAIFFNYLTCVIAGLPFTERLGETFIRPDWKYITLFLAAGLVFVANLRLYSWNTRVAGLGSTAIMSKISLVLPLLLSVIVYHDPLGTAHILGILLAFASILFVNYRKEEGEKSTLLPGISGILLFFSTGYIDCCFKIFASSFASNGTFEFSVLAFGTGGLVGLGVLLLSGPLRAPSFQDVAGGVLLGLFNVFALVCFLEAGKIMEGTTMFPLNHISILLLTALLAAVLYRERLSPLNLIGLVTAVVSILLLIG